MTHKVNIMAELFYLIGASGSGKDSLMAYARKHLPEDAAIVFTHRYITRAVNYGGENHIELTEKEFLARMEKQCFALSWYSHKTFYGIGNELNQCLASGLDVVVNGSRAYLAEAKKIYPGIQPILISVYPEILRRRLEQHGRETPEVINNRLRQAHILEQKLSQTKLIKIHNNGTLKQAGEQFISILTHSKHSQCA